MAYAILTFDPRDQTERERSVDVLSSELRFHLVGFAASKHENVVAVDIGRVAPHRQIGARSSNVFFCLSLACTSAPPSAAARPLLGCEPLPGPSSVRAHELGAMRVGDVGGNGAPLAFGRPEG